MTELSQTILEQYQIRKTKKQKEAFITFLKDRFPELTIELYKGSGTRNLILGDHVNAKVLVSAHYDTCARMPIPNFITPLKPILSIAYSFVILVPMFIFVFLINLLMSALGCTFWTQYGLSIVMVYVLLSLMIFGPANPHTVNDNTSGIISLCELYQSLTEEEKQRVCILFFDNEEKGLLGSGAYRRKHKKEINKQLLINLDCVSDGDHILLAVSKKARNIYTEKLQDAFSGTETKNILFRKAENVYYPSDQAGFPISIAIAALKRKRIIGYYMDRIHTRRDTVMDEENIMLLCRSINRIVKNI